MGTRTKRQQGWLRAATAVVTAMVLAVLSNDTLAGVPQEGPSEGGFSSDNVEWIKHVAEVAPAAATVHQGYLYLTNERSLYIYDLSDPLAPKRVGSWHSDAMIYIAGVSPATNGRLLLMGQTFAKEHLTEGHFPDDSGILRVLDVSDKADPQELATFLGPTGTEAAWACLLDCRWAYGAWSGAIIDLRDPSEPRLAERNWMDGLELVVPPPNVDGVGAGFPPAQFVREVRPGLVLTGTKPMYLLDVRNPVRPRVIGESDGSNFSYGGVDWPTGSRFALSFNILAFIQPSCRAAQLTRGSTFDAGFATWDTKAWKRGEPITTSDRYYLRDGNFANGDPPVSAGLSGCVPGWFDPHPGFTDNGLVGVTATSHGVKFVRISDRGYIREIGHFLPHAGNVYDGHWITDDIFYSIDLHRGIDILRFTGNTG